MKLTHVLLAAGMVAATVAAAPAEAKPGGCIKYGAVGAVAGHAAHHGVLGAVGGCITGMAVRHHYNAQQRAAAAAAKDGAADPNNVPNAGAQPVTPPPGQVVGAPAAK